MSRYRKRSLAELIDESAKEIEKKEYNKELIINSIFVIFWIIVIKYINDLEKNCKCSDNWKRDFIKYSLIIFVILLLFKIILGKSLLSFNKNLLFIFILLNIFFTVIVLLYIKELKENECKCSESNIRTVLELVNYIRTFTIVSGILSFSYLFYKLKK